MQDQRPLSPAIDILSDEPCDPVAISNTTLYLTLMDRYEREGRIDKAQLLSIFIAIVMQYGPDDDQLDPDEDDETVRNEDDEPVFNEPDKIFHIEADHNRN